MTNFFNAALNSIRFGLNATVERYRFIRHMQRGGNPDVLDF